MRVIETNVYKFEELSDSAKDKAVERLRDINLNHDWWDCVYEDAENIGIRITEFGLDRNLHCKIEPMVSALECAANILRDHGVDCDTYKVASEFLESHAPLLARYLDEEGEDYESGELEDEIMELEEEFLCSMADCYASILQREYEYLYSDEAVIDTIIANEYEFTEDGKLI